MISYKQTENERLLINKNAIPNTPTKHVYLGDVKSTDDVEYFKGRMNSHYTDSYLPYRFVLTTPFYPRISSGKVVNIEVEESEGTQEKSVLYSGKWLVCEAVRTADDNGVYSQKLILSKSKINMGR